MKGNHTFSMRSVGDVYLLVPLREDTFRGERILPTNEVGALLWETLKKDCTEETLVAAILDQYDIKQDTALADIREFLESLDRAGALDR